MTTTNEPKVLSDDGTFHATDAPIDLSIYGWEDWLSLGFFLLLAIDIFYQFFTRYVLSDSAAWTEEIARYLLIIVVFLGGSMAVRKNSHIHVEFLYRYLPAWMGRSISTFVDVVRVAFLGYATVLTCQLIPKMHNLSMTVIDVPMSYIYGFVALGFALMTMRSVQVAIKHWRQGWSTLERPMEGIEV
ncbi:MAG: TRAP transporter small permease [Betaproteobacteria bacterium]|nr:MAG: TRAP transporter small permease [Betaproteobacteria bacterium]